MNKLTRRTLMVGAGAIAVAVGAGVALFNGPVAEAVETGAQAPAFSVLDANGRTRTLSEFAGRTVVLEWTNFGCPYVRKHYSDHAGTEWASLGRNMQRLQQEATADGVVWLQVISSAPPNQQGYLDAAGALARVQTDQAHPTATLLDPTGAMGHAYGATNTPHMYIINGSGRLVYQGAIDDRPSARPNTLEGATNYVRAALADLRANRAVATATTTAYGCDVKYA